jgi:hypothetical protein
VVQSVGPGGGGGALRFAGNAAKPRWPVGPMGVERGCEPSDRSGVGTQQRRTQSR